MNRFGYNLFMHLKQHISSSIIYFSNNLAGIVWIFPTEPKLEAPVHNNEVSDKKKMRERETEKKKNVILARLISTSPLQSPPLRPLLK